LIERCADDHTAANGHAANGYAGQFAYDCDDPNHEEELADDDNEDDEEIAKNDKNEPLSAFLHRQLQNVIHFFVEDWFLSAMLGVITAVLSISVDVAIEYLQQFRLILYEHALKFHAYSAAICWILYITLMTGGAAAVCHAFSKHAVGSGIPEVKVIMHGFVMKNYLTFKTLIVKMISLTLALGSGLPIGKELSEFHGFLYAHCNSVILQVLTTRLVILIR
uniref:Chloride channel protein n=1 Tax=Anisakis simplex TaxID=6269 RepID=A0A0M3KF28_ANISI